MLDLDKELIFEVMVTFPHLLEREIEDFNNFYGTDFILVETILDEVTVCRIKVSKYKPSHLFSLGYSLAALQYMLKDKGELEW